MGTREQRAAGRTDDEPTAMESWAAGELDDQVDRSGAAWAAAAMAGLLVALTLFFLAFAPGA